MDKEDWYILLLFVGVVVIPMIIFLKVISIINSGLTELFYKNETVIIAFIELHPYLTAILLTYCFISILTLAFVFVVDFMSMCGSDHPFKNLILWTFFWFPMFFYYMFNFNLRKCCRCKEKKKIEVRYKNGQQFCYECWKARFKEPHTCSVCGEKKLLCSFKKDGSKYCEECHNNME